MNKLFDKMAIFKMAGSATMNQLGEPDSETAFKHLIKVVISLLTP